MAEPLFKTWDPPETVAERRAAEAAPSYPESARFDFEAGDFVVDGAGRAEIADGYTAWAQQVLKCFLTQRYAYPIYSREYGVDWRGCLALDAPQQPAAIEVELRRALRRLPGTKAVRDFAFGRAGDVLTVGLTAVPFEGAPLPLGRVLHA
jgi:hypothetical protein